jgi:hypothetical protein
VAEKLDAVKSEEETLRGKVLKLGLAATDDEGALWLALSKIHAATEETLDSTIAWLVAECYLRRLEHGDRLEMTAKGEVLGESLRRLTVL